MRTSWLLDRGWLVIAVAADDVRKNPAALCRRVQTQLALRTSPSKLPFGSILAEN